ncbi:MAG TPA: exonuclease SbcCD subunit D C-terminal domain-containing protein [Burkholderiaceae bacterium]|nr:exonuclease SbcCD subunit D C-terminal domain-containing protein [Burkholderiaceae bacterium]
MKILHTSDWHLGRSLHGRARYAEFEGFLAWLLEALEQHAIDVLLVAGDIFDTTTPTHRAQALYYQFLARVAQTGCRHVVIIAGNHDSPSLLEAPQSLLEALQVHVVARADQGPEHEIVLLKDARNHPELLVCAVPYLRDRDVRAPRAGETLADKEQQLKAGIREHYEAVVTAACQLGEQLTHPVPLVAMGHLFAAGAQTVAGDGVRDLYVGSLAHLTADIFPSAIDYVALGHLHVPQSVGGNPAIRYSGSPLPMGFGEADHQKSVCVVSMTPDAARSASWNTRIATVPIPRFQALKRLQGNWDDLFRQLQELVATRQSWWVEVVIDAPDVVADWRGRLDDVVRDSNVEVLRVCNHRRAAQTLAPHQPDETLDDLTPDQVFERCLQAHDVPEAQWAALFETYHEVLHTLYQADSKAE